MIWSMSEFHPKVPKRQREEHAVALLRYRWLTDPANDFIGITHGRPALSAKRLARLQRKGTR